VGGFGVAELTGVRALGGLVLLVGAVACARAMAAGPGRTALALGVALALFVLSHPLGHAIGAWPAVLVSALLAAAAVERLTPAR
jgi:hypothetical protein